MSDNCPKNGEFCWNELATPNPEKAGKFYSQLLGWQAADAGMEGMPYTVFKIGDKQVAGMYKMPPEMGNMPPHWMAYVTVADADASSKKAVELGGRLLFGPMDIPKLGRFCVVADPTGAALALITFAG